MNRLLDLFLTFARIGGLTFGGGYAMLPILQREVVEKKKWTTEEELMDYYAIGQCTPGVIAVNTATFVGQGLAGPIGGIVATSSRSSQRLSRTSHTLRSSRTLSRGSVSVSAS